MLNAIGGLDKVQKGKIYIDGDKITKVPTARRDKIRSLKIGYIFQNYHLLNHLTVSQNVALVLKMIGIKKKDEIAKRVNYVLEILGMYPYRNRLSFMLSGGQKQRVAIARAIVKNPNIIIADEPTGNLDSKNTIEIMNILKTISKEKLVILVTHEKELAKFYASRIIKVVDGKIISDEKNENEEELDYRMYHNIYLKDMPYHETIKQKEIQIEYYGEKQEDIFITMAMKNGNLYIQSNQKVESVDENSSIELVDDHYKKMSKEIYEKYRFHPEEVLNDSNKKRYASIYHLFSMLLEGTKKIFHYSTLKKILLLGFFISAMFIVYAISSIFGASNIKDEKFVTTNRDYLSVISFQNKVEDYLAYENLDFIDYILPGDSKMDFEITYPDYYQTARATQTINVSIVGIHRLEKQDLIYGRMPENNQEIVLDTMVFDQIFYNVTPRQLGITTKEQFMGRQLRLGGEFTSSANNGTELPEFTIVGITDKKSPSIYLAKENFINMLAMNQKNQRMNYTEQGNNDIKLVDVNLVQDEITLKKGRMPEGDYEIIVNHSFSSQMKLNKTIDATVNGQKLKVVGYYESKYGKEEYYANPNTVKYQVIENSQNLVICPKDKAQTISYFLDNHNNIEDTYQRDRNAYIQKMKPQILASITVSGVILFISLIEIFLMIRSSFLSRKKEVGILRAIGVKKSDIYKLFLGEILAIDLFVSLPGIAFMSYIVKHLSMTSYLGSQFVFHAGVVEISVAIVFIIHIIIRTTTRIPYLKKNTS